MSGDSDVLGKCLVSRQTKDEDEMNNCESHCYSCSPAPSIAGKGWQLARTQHQKEHVAGLTFLIDRAKGGSSSAYESVKGLPLGMIQVWSTLNRTLCPRSQSTHLLSKDQILGWSKRPEWTQEEKPGTTAVFECLIEDPFLSSSHAHRELQHGLV